MIVPTLIWFNKNINSVDVIFKSSYLQINVYVLRSASYLKRAID